MELSHEELTFAILDESHRLACEVLSNLVLEAVKANYPDDWKEKVCGSFSASTRNYVKECLENSLPVTDIYVVCKIFRCHINDIAKYHDHRGFLSDSQNKERLSLQVQGIEAARNMVFHGDGLSAGEVRSSIALLLFVFATLRTEEASTEKVVSLLKFVERLSVISSSSGDLEGCSLPVQACARGLLYGSLDVFQELFQDLFGIKTPPGFSSKSQHCAKTNEKEISSLVKRIKQEIHKPRKDSLVNSEDFYGKKVDRRSFVAIAQNVATLRNQLTHNKPLSVSDVGKGLQNVNTIICTFGLASGQAMSAVKRLSVIKGLDSAEHINVKLMLSKMSAQGLQCDVKHRHRVLRPGCLEFVGRREEIDLILTTLSNQNHYPNTVVIIYGPAGIGKSYMTIHLLRILKESHPRQVWLCCSSEQTLYQDLYINRHCFFSGLCTQGKEGHSKSAKPKRSPSETDIAQLDCKERKTLVQERLLAVFDDVSSSCLSALANIITNRKLSLIITTRSTTVRTFFQRLLPFVLVVQLQPFMPTESYELIRSKTQHIKNSDVHVIARADMKEVLGNLPLCVSIYSSLLAFAAKPRVYGKCLDIDSASLLKNWREIEEQFGDRLHVRGLTGVVQSSEKYLEDHPFAVFLLAKICWTDSKSILWDVIRKKPDSGVLLSLEKNQCFKVPWVRAFCSELLGVLDYLFSDDGQEVLETCRNNLEEFGLISWHNAANVVKIHRLTLSALQDLLQKRRLYLDSLLPLAMGDAETRSWIAECEAVYRYLAADQLIGLLYRSNELLAIHENDKTHHENIDEAFIYNVCTILMNAIESKFCQTIFKDDLTTTERMELFTMLLKRLGNGLSTLGLVHFGTSVICNLVNILRNSPDPLTKVEARFLYNLIQGGRSNRIGLWKKNLSFYAEALASLQYMKITNPDIACGIHLSIAQVLEDHEGPSVRKYYHLEALKTCPRLVAENDTREKLLCLRETHSGLEYHTLPNKQSVCNWHRLLRFRIRDSVLEQTQLDETTMDCILMLISVLEESQETLIKKIEHQQLCTSLDKVKQVNAISCVILYTSVKSDLLFLINQGGLSLRARAKALRVFKGYFLPVSDSLNNEDRHDFWIEWASLLQVSCFSVSSYGAFSLACAWSNHFSSLWVETLSAEGLGLSCAENGTQNTASHCSPHLVNEERPRDLDCGGGEHICNQLSDLFFQGLSFVYKEKNFHSALMDFVTVLNRLVILRSRYSNLMTVFQNPQIENFVLQHVIALSALLGKDYHVQVVPKLIALEEKCTTLPSLQKSLQRTVSHLDVLSEYTQLRTLYERFVEARGAFQKGNLASARKASLKYWKETESSGIVDFGLEGAAKGVIDDKISLLLECLLIEVAGYLRHIYSSEKKYVVGEWLFKIRARLAKENGWLVISAAYEMEYVEFLKTRERWSDALEKCRAVEWALIEEFGGDYFDWLPDAPNATHLRKSLEQKLFMK